MSVYSPKRTAPRMIEAAVVSDNHQLKFEKLRLSAPRRNEVGVRIVACGICHTDISFFSPGAVLGHEGAGIVEQIGSAVTTVKPGDHVVLSFQSCGQCDACSAHSPADCEHFSTLNFGFSRLDGSSAYPPGISGHFFGQSSFASYALVTEQNLVKVGKSLPLATLAPLGCGLQTGAGTVMNTLKVKKSDRLLVIGTGAVGMAAVMAAKIAGAKEIIALDQHQHRRDLALELGATEAMKTGKERSLRETLDYVIDTAGVSALDKLGQDALKDGGTMVRLTGTGGATLSRGRKILSVIQGDSVAQAFIPKMITLWQAGQFPFDRLLHFYDFQDIRQAIDDAACGKVMKAVLRWPAQA
ncbi:NAD(P)-dependent alcohol dehydrogenase [Rahnella sp. BCC 1045]|uniref:NAD(P)-dependent alcohol dehydrogenase n=1 Tax=Rahnella sp. BCC 1045 TaxID=2816251 RepID=UPI001C27AD76|nr:NAD(P)-dependent alcohol dehydrogenase [Rahnella sp. BCC 1045]MBU9820915.1 NAD(P)-dependent alcohol dehydrogenase [Rahnella sp. BCC 1045]